MLITEKEALIKYSTPYRLWQGIPSIEVTSKGRIFSTFYSGGTREEIGNFSMVLVSDDGGKTFSEPVAVAYKEKHRCYDPCLWIDPQKRLWFTWCLSPEHAVYGVCCENPDADTLEWSDEILIGNDVMMNKPTVLTTGEWLFPITVWKANIGAENNKDPNADRRAFVYKTIDNGKTFTKMGGVAIRERSFDEHMILERQDGTLAMYIRTHYGIGVSYSYDRGKTWTNGENSGLGGPDSRFHIRRLKSGRVLLVNHFDFKGRNNLYAMLSEDDGKTFPYKLLLDERDNVSYPDCKEADDGYIYITYDRERASYVESLEKAYGCAREILMAKITEEDILKGKISDNGSELKCIVSKLGKFINEETENPFGELKKFSDVGLAEFLNNRSNESIFAFLFENYAVNCANMASFDFEKLDSLVEEYTVSGDKKILCSLIAHIRKARSEGNNSTPIVDRIKKAVEESIFDEITTEELAKKLGISLYYMCHLFKKTTGITIVEYKNETKITKAKYLLVNTNKRITEIAGECGFQNDSYFTKVFSSLEGVTPSEYRKALKK